MKNTILCALACLGFGAIPSYADTSVLAERAQNAATVLKEWTEMTSVVRIPAKLLASAKCLVVIPNLTKAAFIIGARHGEGLASCRGATGAWSNPLFFKLTGVSWGFQAGIQRSDTVLVFTNERAIDRLSTKNITLGADSSLAIGPIGRQAELATDWMLKSEIFSYSRDRGLFAGLSLSGAHLAADRSDNAEVYGAYVPMNEQVSVATAAPAMLRDFLSTLDQIAP